jgi:hypothetical protein
VEGQNYLGIYLSNSGATVVCLGSQGRAVLGCFSVALEQRGESGAGADMSELARLAAEGCAQRQFKFSDVAVALDCAMFMQHNVHSEFSDPKQIAQTVRFDTEEALSTDIADVAVAFKVASTDQSGSQLTVFTAQRQVLSDVILALQNNGMDPITVEPDVNCLSRFVSRNVSLPEDSSCLFGALSRRNGYFVGFGKSRQAPVVRTFLIAPPQDRNHLLARQILLTTGLLGGDGPVKCLKVFDSAGTVDCRQLTEKLGIEAAGIDLADCAGADPQLLDGCADVVDFAVAYGAALAHLEKLQNVNFRNDFMPYQGGKLRLQKTLKFLSVSISILMAALGMYVTSQLLQTNKYQSRLRGKFRPQYSAVMLGQKPPRAIKDAKRKLGSTARRIKSQKEGLISDEDISAKLRLVLEAFNRCAAKTKLNIDSISITSKTIRITGDTSSRRNTLTLRREIARAGLGNVHESFERTKSGREGFRITIELGRQSKGTRR